MSPRDIALAVVLVVIWGFNFVVIKVGLDAFPPLLFAGIRFVVAALPVLFLPRPRVPVAQLALIALTLFVGQFGFLFPAMVLGMPPGLASITLQSQAFFTILIATVLLGERPRPLQFLGVAIAIGGLVAIGSTAGAHSMTVIGLVLTIASAASWGTGNVLMRRAGPAEALPMISWLSLFTFPPLLALSFLIEGPERIAGAMTSISLLGVGALAYVVVLSTWFGFGLWGNLLKRYPASIVAPFTLLVPVTGILSSVLLLGESFDEVRLAGMALIMLGLVVNLAGARRPAAA